MKNIMWVLSVLLAGVAGSAAEQIDEVYFNPSPTGKYQKVYVTDQVDAAQIAAQNAEFASDALFFVGGNNVGVSSIGLSQDAVVKLPTGTSLTATGLDNAAKARLSGAYITAQQINIANGLNVLRLGNGMFISTPKATVPDYDNCTLQWQERTISPSDTVKVLAFSGPSCQSPGSGATTGDKIFSVASMVPNAGESDADECKTNFISNSGYSTEDQKEAAYNLAVLMFKDKDISESISLASNHPVAKDQEGSFCIAYPNDSITEKWSNVPDTNSAFYKEQFGVTYNTNELEKDDSSTSQNELPGDCWAAGKTYRVPDWDHAGTNSCKANYLRCQKNTKYQNVPYTNCPGLNMDTAEGINAVIDFLGQSATDACGQVKKALPGEMPANYECYVSFPEPSQELSAKACKGNWIKKDGNGVIVDRLIRHPAIPFYVLKCTKETPTTYTKKTIN